MAKDALKKKYTWRFFSLLPKDPEAESTTMYSANAFADAAVMAKFHDASGDPMVEYTHGFVSAFDMNDTEFAGENYPVIAENAIIGYRFDRKNVNAAACKLLARKKGDELLAEWNVQNPHKPRTFLSKEERASAMSAAKNELLTKTVMAPKHVLVVFLYGDQLVCIGGATEKESEAVMERISRALGCRDCVGAVELHELPLHLISDMSSMSDKEHEDLEYKLADDHELMAPHFMGKVLQNMWGLSETTQAAYPDAGMDADNVTRQFKNAWYGTSTTAVFDMYPSDAKMTAGTAGIATEVQNKVQSSENRHSNLRYFMWKNSGVLAAAEFVMANSVFKAAVGMNIEKPFELTVTTIKNPPVPVRRKDSDDAKADMDAALALWMNELIWAIHNVSYFFRMISGIRLNPVRWKEQERFISEWLAMFAPACEVAAHAAENEHDAQ